MTATVMRAKARHISLFLALNNADQVCPAELTFSSGYSNDDRAVVHAEAKKFGFKSKSTGYAMPDFNPEV